MAAVRVLTQNLFAACGYVMSPWFGVVLLYLTNFPMLYMHMLAQRKRTLGSGGASRRRSELGPATKERSDSTCVRMLLVMLLRVDRQLPQHNASYRYSKSAANFSSAPL